MSHQPTTPGLSDRLKHLERAGAPLASPGFDVDAVVRGGRRRRRRRTAGQVAAAVVAVAALSTGIALPQLRNNEQPVPPAAVPTTSAAPKPALPAIDLATDASLTYKMSGKTVTVTRKGAPVTTMTLQSASYTDTSGHLVFQFTAARPLIVDTDMFVLYDSQGENSADKPAKVHMDAGPNTLTLDFSHAVKPEAVGWAPADGEVVWNRPK